MHVLLMALAAAGSIALVAVLTERLTGDPGAAAVGGLSMPVLPGYVVRPALGYKPKYFILVVGLLSLVLTLRGHVLLGGVAAGATTGFW